MTDEEVRTAQGRQLRRQGLVLNDPSVLSAMERTEGGFRFLPVEGRSGKDYLVTPEQMELLERYVVSVLLRCAGELAQGNIDADPYWRDLQKNACRWCEFQPACHFEPDCGDVQRFRRAISAEEFWQWMNGQEEDKHGL